MTTFILCLDIHGVYINMSNNNTHPMFCLLQPFSLEQLSVWEPGGGLQAWLEGVEVCAAQFCALARQENHELTELLQNYWRCRRQLTQSHTQLHTQSSDCKSAQNRLWSFRDEQLTLQVFFCFCFFGSVTRNKWQRGL